MDLKVTIPKAGAFETAYRMAPRLTLLEMNKAMRAGLAEVSKREVDRYFQFKTPRSMRTGNLQRFFQMNTATAMATLARQKTAVYSETFSTVKYADKVAESNPFYERILKAAQPDIDNHFGSALDNIFAKIEQQTS